MRFVIVLIAMLTFAMESCSTSVAEADYRSSLWSIDTGSIKVKAQEAKEFCTQRKMDANFCILADIGQHSGRKRLYVYDFKGDSIAYVATVSHGCGTAPWGEDDTRSAPQISNVENSHCTSIGKYRIGSRGASQWGIGVNYLLHGLEATNDNAVKRAIVLHSWDKIADSEQYPEGTPEGWGCPAVSDNTMRYLDERLKEAKLPVLLWIYRNENKILD